MEGIRSTSLPRKLVWNRRRSEAAVARVAEAVTHFQMAEAGRTAHPFEQQDPYRRWHELPPALLGGPHPSPPESAIAVIGSRLRLLFARTD